ncbi:MAG: hypothetical protein IJL86_04470, partial [Bacteroidales bacterium]|nr:hypothetical protein [Bacteroidales bacterium]
SCSKFIIFKYNSFSRLSQNSPGPLYVQDLQSALGFLNAISAPQLLQALIPLSRSPGAKEHLEHRKMNLAGIEG